MKRRIGESRFEIAAGVVVLPICGADEKRDGWQVVVDGEYDNDFRLKREAVKHAETVAAARCADDLRRDPRPTTDTPPAGLRHTAAGTTTMHYVVQKIFAPSGEQLDSDYIADFRDLHAASAMVERLATEQDACPPNTDENRCSWHVESD